MNPSSISVISIVLLVFVYIFETGFDISQAGFKLYAVENDLELLTLLPLASTC